MLKRVATLFSVHAVLCSTLFASPEQWIEVRSPHFTVLTDSNEKQARHTLDQFERMRWMFQTLFPKSNVDPAAPIVVFAARNTKTFQEFEPAAYLASGQLKLGGFFLRTQDKNYVLLRLDAEEEHPFAVIYHEYTHLQFSSASEWMPLWLNEGAAEFFQNTEIRNKDVQIGEPSVDDILYLRQNKLIPLNVLFKVDASSPYYHEENKGSVFYAESWALTHYLQITDRVKGTHKVSDYMVRMSHHEDPVIAGQEAFGDLKQLQAVLESYIRENRYMQFILSSAAAPIDESTYKVKALTQTEADAARADVLANDTRVKDARTLLDAVLKADPNNVQAHETMGSLEFRDGNREAARKWYEEAVKLDSQSYLANYYFAVMSMETGASDQDANIEASLRAAIRLNPRFAPAYDQLGSFLGMRRKNLEEAYSQNLHAIELDPGNLGFRMNASNVLMTMGRYNDAASMLQSSANVARNPREVAMVQERISQLGQIRAAQTQANASSEVQTGERTIHMVAADAGPKHPTEAPNGAKHEVLGVIEGVHCSYPSVIDFEVQAEKRTVRVYNNDYYKLEFSTIGFMPEGDLNPCSGIEGMKARAQYAESSDKTVDGQVIAVELRK